MHSDQRVLSIDTLRDRPRGFPIRSLRREVASFHNRSEGPSCRLLCRRYELNEKIGSGGMGEIYSAIDKESSTRVAVKIAPERIPSEISMRVMEKEARALSNLRHNGIVLLLGEDISEHDGRSFLVLELIEGKTLGDILKDRGRLPFLEVKPIMLQLCDALQAVHDALMIHRDVKPANIMVLPGQPASKIKLIDFGIVLFTDHLGRNLEFLEPGIVAGTPFYVPPEALYESIIDSRADIYGAGIVMYEMLTSTNPFREEGRGFLRAFDLVRSKIPAHPSDVSSDIPRDVGDVVMRAIEKRPEERYQTMREMSEAIIACR